MKRNEIYNELVKIRKLVDPKIDNLIYGKLSRLIDAVNDDRHTNYDQFECVEDIVSRFDQLRKQMHVIEKDITWIKLGDFSKRGEND